MAEACQHAENAFVGARCGIINQFAVVFGRQHHCVRLELPIPRLRRDFAPRFTPPGDLRSTMTRHAHASGGYNRRREECSEAVTRLQALMPALTSLRDLSWRDFEAHRHVLSDLLARRVRHVLSRERSRDSCRLGAARAGPQGRSATAWPRHQSRCARTMKSATPSSNLMVALARQQRGVHGARMTGGESRGCTINLVTTAAADGFADAMREEPINVKPASCPTSSSARRTDGAAPALEA